MQFHIQLKNIESLLFTAPPQRKMVARPVEIVFIGHFQVRVGCLGFLDDGPGFCDALLDHELCPPQSSRECTSQTAGTKAISRLGNKPLAATWIGKRSALSNVAISERILQRADP